MNRSAARLGSHALGVGISTALLPVLLSVASAHMAGAAGVVGTGTAASCTDAAFNGALTGGGVVTFDCGGAATITVTSTKTISTDTTIDGGGVITISGGHSVGVFSVNAGVKFTVQNLTIANGSSTSHGGGGIGNGGTLTVTNSTFSGNSSDYNGGGIANSGTATVTSSTFSGNSAAGTTGGGGGIGNSGTLTVTNSTFSSNNSAGGGGAIGISSTGTATVTNSTFSDNGSAGTTAGGGGVGNSGMLRVTNSTFSGNRADYDGGGIGSSGAATVTNSTFSGNSSASTTGGGGGIGNGGTLTVTNSTFSGNRADYDGGGIGSSGTGTVTNSTFSGNSAVHGGGIAAGATLTVTNTIVAKSTSGGNCTGSVTDGGHNIDDGTTCGFTGTGCTTTTGSSFCNTNPVLDPTGLQNNGGPTQTIALCTGPGAPSAGCTGASPAIDAGDESVCSTTTGTAPVDNLDQRGFVRPGAGAVNCSVGAFEANSASPCVGDCNGNGQVTVDEILTMVNIALGNTPVTTCEAGDANHDGEITVDEILTAVNNALNGCGG